jgi:phosphoribosylanthranilate isomerase
MAPETVPRTVVKVCGITRLADAHAALDAGADWLGFVVYRESPRQVDVGAAAEIIAAVPHAIGVLVMVAPGPDEALATARRMGARRLQLHRVEPATWPTDFPLPTAFAVQVGEDGGLTGAMPPPGHLLLLDTADAVRPGGTGRSFPWQHAAALAAGRAVMLAGGLGPDNVAEALARVRPFGVDAASQLESAPGIKDPERVRQFVAAVRAHDALRGAA